MNEHVQHYSLVEHCSAFLVSLTCVMRIDSPMDNKAGVVSDTKWASVRIDNITDTRRTTIVAMAVFDTTIFGSRRSNPTEPPIFATIRSNVCESFIRGAIFCRFPIVFYALSDSSVYRHACVNTIEQTYWSQNRNGNFIHTSSEWLHFSVCGICIKYNWRIIGFSSIFWITNDYNNRYRLTAGTGYGSHRSKCHCLW